MLVDPLAQRLGVLEALRLGGRVEDDGVQLARSVAGGACERGARQRGEAGLDADGMLVDVEEPVGRLQVDGRLRAVAHDRDVGAAAGDDGAEHVVFHGVANHGRHIGRRAVQIARILVVIEAVGVLVDSVGAAELGRLLVHPLDERLDASSQRLGDGHSRVVAGRHEQRLERRLQVHDVAFLQAGRRLPHGRSRRGHGDGRVERRLARLHGVERHDGRHDLRDGGDLRGALSVALEVHGAFRVHHEGVLRVDAGALRHGQPPRVDGLPQDDVGLAHVGEGWRGEEGAKRGGQDERERARSEARPARTGALSPKRRSGMSARASQRGRRPRVGRARTLPRRAWPRRPLPRRS